MHDRYIPEYFKLWSTLLVFIEGVVADPLHFAEMAPPQIPQDPQHRFVLALYLFWSSRVGIKNGLTLVLSAETKDQCALTSVKSQEDVQLLSGSMMVIR